MEARAKKIQRSMTMIFILSIALLSLPALLVIFFNIHRNIFIALNTIGLLLATFRIVVSVSTSIAANAVKEETTDYKKRMDKEAKWLFLITMVLQLVNFMFIQFN